MTRTCTSCCSDDFSNSRDVLASATSPIYTFVTRVFPPASGKALLHGIGEKNAWILPGTAKNL